MKEVTLLDMNIGNNLLALLLPFSENTPITSPP